MPSNSKNLLKQTNAFRELVGGYSTQPATRATEVRPSAKEHPSLEPPPVKRKREDGSTDETVRDAKKQEISKSKTKAALQSGRASAGFNPYGRGFDSSSFLDDEFYISPSYVKEDSQSGNVNRQKNPHDSIKPTPKATDMNPFIRFYSPVKNRLPFDTKSNTHRKSIFAKTYQRQQQLPSSSSSSQQQQQKERQQQYTSVLSDNTSNKSSLSKKEVFSFIKNAVKERTKETELKQDRNNAFSTRDDTLKSVQNTLSVMQKRDNVINLERENHISAQSRDKLITYQHDLEKRMQRKFNSLLIGTELARGNMTLNFELSFSAEVENMFKQYDTYTPFQVILNEPQILKKDFDLLRYPEFINDNVINFFSKAVLSEKTLERKIFSFSTYFYTKLCSLQSSVFISLFLNLIKFSS